ncbi:hypothetical protein B481_2707 [Planococcus halocryophilus Or1]|uniref:Group-specific protein n=1 Tax=Planococcus halocryophilus TaxID=1215089 RepID=A0A1C7DPG5_9BACL|nr:nucleoside 2-deoxyribosyltransferase [Planococcus halocryophilus]ANU13292.1 group-specific protein [Planococcus halocryophilus]EMF45864.1 hypothetical protein B481_2707 [Planococcus halocryophilus Or1]
MKFYVASSFKNKEQVQYVSHELTMKGFVHSYDWTKNERPSTLEALTEIGTKEKDAVMNSDVVIVLLPGGKGSHIELGMAIAAKKKVFLYSPDNEIDDLALTSTFYQLPEVQKVIGTIDDLILTVCSE